MFGLGVWGHLLNFGVGLIFRFLNEERKTSQMNHELHIAAATQRHEFMQEARANVSKTPVLQFFMGIMLITSLLALIAFPIAAVYLDVPLAIIFERTVTSGFWIFESTKVISTIEYIHGLFLPHEFQIVIVAILEFITGAVVGGLGRR